MVSLALRLTECNDTVVAVFSFDNSAGLTVS